MHTQGSASASHSQGPFDLWLVDSNSELKDDHGNHTDGDGHYQHDNLFGTKAQGSLQEWGRGYGGERRWGEGEGVRGREVERERYIILPPRFLTHLCSFRALCFILITNGGQHVQKPIQAVLQTTSVETHTHTLLCKYMYVCL